MRPKTKILAITRDQTMVTLLQKELNDGNYEIISTEHNDIQLKDVVEAEYPDFIILDIVIPTLDGIGVCLALRQWTQTPIMMLSTWDTGNGMVRGLNLGRDNYLTDPFSVDVLKKRINDTLKRAKVVPSGSLLLNKN
jgi:DNA-binding response OmpR family regulator